MNLVEQHIIEKSNSSFKELDDLCFKSKNIYNSTLYLWRQKLINDKNFISSKESYKLIKELNSYTEIPQNVAVATFNLVYQNIRAYFASLKSFKRNPNSFSGLPRMPKYKNSENGRCIAIFNKRVIPKKNARKDGIIRFTGLNFSVKSKIPVDAINQVRFIPKDGLIVVEIVYTVNTISKEFNGLCAAIDLGLNNLATITSNNAKPIIINGKPLKSVNQFFNKKKTKIQSTLQKRNKKKWSKKLARLQRKRNNKVKDYLHKAGKKVIDYCLVNNITLLAIGKNNSWKQSINLGSKNNQNFVQIPHSKLIQIIKYKCELKGVKVEITEESYTSKCSFIDNEEIKNHKEYKGKRQNRGLFISNNGTKINADCNGSFNILRKVIPSTHYNELRDRGLVVSPVVILP